MARGGVMLSASHRALHAAAVRHATHKKSEQLSNGRPIALPIIPKSPPVCRFHTSQRCSPCETVFPAVAGRPLQDLCVGVLPGAQVAQAPSSTRGADTSMASRVYDRAQGLKLRVSAVREER